VGLELGLNVRCELVLGRENGGDGGDGEADEVE